jgi:tetratricopeptide (TPR) repeat protein
MSKRDMQNKKNVLFRVNHLLRCVLIAMCWTGIYAAAAQETPACEAGVDYFAQAQLLNERKSTEKAIEAYTCAIQANPQLVNLYLGRGWSYLTLFQYEKAIADFEIAEGLTPYWQTQYYMGKAYAGLNRHEEAIPFYDRALAGQPNYIHVLIDRGVSYVALKEYELAIADFDKALELDSGNVMALAERGRAYVQQHNYEAARADLNRLVEIDSSYKQSYVDYLAIGDYIVIVTKLQTLSDSLQSEPDNVTLLVQRGNVYMQLGDYDPAMDDFNHVIELDPQNAEAYYARGSIYGVFQQDYEAAFADFDRAIALDPDFPKLYVTRGTLNFYFLKDYEAAIADFNYFLSLPSDAPDDTYAYVYLNKGNLDMLTGRELEAAIDFLEYIAWAGLSSTDAGTLTIGQREKVTMGGNDLLRFTFEAQAGEKYKLSAIPDNPDIRIDTLLLVISPDGSPLIANDDFNPETDSSAIIPVFEAPEEGLYTVVVTHGRHPDQGVIQVLVQTVPEIHSAP